MLNSSKNLYKKLLGVKGEKLAESFLKKHGFKILERNYRVRGGEADIIAEKDNIIAFVEVKTRTSEKFGRPCEAVDYRKQQKYRVIAETYLCLNSDCKKQPRFDVIEVLNDEINYIEDAF